MRLIFFLSFIFLNFGDVFGLNWTEIDGTQMILMPRCPPNEVWNRCGPDPCMATCDRPAQFCTAMCNPSQVQCTCQRGFVRHNGRCIPWSQCPKQCSDPNQIRTACWENCTCDELNRHMLTSATGKPECPTVCAALAPYSPFANLLPCLCKPGYLADGTVNGRCIAKDRCNLPCPNNSDRQFCGRICTCDEFQRTGRCREQCADANGGKRMCYCKSGFVLDQSPNGQCISERQCLNQSTNCTDSDLLCPFWASAGECTRNPKYMISNCRRSCAPECSGEDDDSCLDQNRNCDRWAKRGECWRRPDYMHWKCRKACGVCGDLRISLIAPGVAAGGGAGTGIAPPAHVPGDYPDKK